MKNTPLIFVHLLTCRGRLPAALVALSALAFGPPPAQAAVTEAWVHRYSNVVSNAQDQAVKVVRDPAGDIIVTGTTDGGTSGRDILTIKYSGASGSVLWQKRYNGPRNGIDYALAATVDRSGNVVVMGSSTGTNNTDDYYTAKYAAADGALLWERRYKGPSNFNVESVAGSVAVDDSGNVVVTGYLSNGEPYYDNDFYTAKFAAADGALLWEQQYNGPTNNNDEAWSVAVDGSGNVVVTGFSYNNNGNTDYYTAKYGATDGALLWEQRYNGPADGCDYATAVAVDGSGDVVVTGYSYATNYAYYTAKYAAADGALLWEQRHNSPANDAGYATAVAVDSSGNVVVTGFSRNFPNGDYYTAKYAAADGALLWEKRHNGQGDFSEDRAQAVAVDGSGNIVVTGNSGTIRYLANGTEVWTNNAGAAALAVDGSGNVVVTGSSYSNRNSDFYTAKYAAADGALLWEQRYNGPLNHDDQARAVAVDRSGNVVVTGSSAGDYYTAKYATTDGALLWEKRYNNGSASAVAVDRSGNVVVTGSSANGTNGEDYYTAKYAAANGALLWEQRYNGPANGHDQAYAVAADDSGNVVVTGSSGQWPNYDYYTAKYAAADGALLWEKRYNSPGNSYDHALAVAVDGNGNVVVTGLSEGNGSSSDYYTAKYAAADGALLWEKRYDGPANSGDGASAVAVDSSGNVVVTGHSEGNGSSSDYYTAKYAAADGALLWEKRYNGPRNTYDYAWAVAVDSSGNVVVTGSSYSNGNSDYYTAKYAATDGALLWERYDGPAYVNDTASAVSVDGSGNVVVTRSSAGDYYTAQYAAADGALLWEQRYNGPANGDDFVTGPRSLALGPNGMVAVTGSSNGDYATVVYRETLPPISIALVPTGVRLRASGVPGHSYTIKRAPAVTGPWSTINTQTVPASALLEYLDATPLPGSAFYRTVTP